MLMTGSGAMDAERAFVREARARRRALLFRRLRRRPATGDRLPVYGGPMPADGGGGGVRAIPLDEIRGTLEPSSAALFDRCFRPSRAVRARWERVWLAEHRGTALPPISAVCVGNGYAVRDGHHRISVARARGAVAIDASVGP